MTSRLRARRVRVRVAARPRPARPHVGFARTALYNWAFARHHGGTFVFRIEDTDKERNTEESYDAMLDADAVARPRLGRGPRGRRPARRRTARASAATSTPTCSRGCADVEVHLRLLLHHRGGRRAAQGVRLQGAWATTASAASSPTEQVAAFEAEGRQPVVRFRMPDGSITWDDLVRGEITFETEFVPDFALCRANGDPLYTLVNPVDDALMEITHVLRGEDLLSSTPRQIALLPTRSSSSASRRRRREFGHLPYVMGEGNKKLSKRDPQAHLFALPRPGLPARGAAQLPGPARLGDRRGPRRLHPRRDGRGVRHQGRQPQPGPLRPEEGRGDQRLAHAAALARGDHRPGAAVPPGRRRASPTRSTDADAQLLDAAMPLVAERINKLTEAVDMLGFLFVDEAAFTRDEADVEKLLDDDGPRRRAGVVRRARGAARVVDRRDPGGAAGGAGRRAGPQAAQRLRAGPRGRHRPPGVAAAVRVAGAARPRARPRRGSQSALA